jgi:hypothetical protein
MLFDVSELYCYFGHCPLFSNKRGKVSSQVGLVERDILNHWKLNRVRESELLYNWRFTVSQFVLVASRLRLMTQQFYFSTEYLWLYSLCNILSDERMGLSFIIAASPRQHTILRSE